MQTALAATSNRFAFAFAALVGVTQILLVLGALVRAHAAGLACPDWPLCFGEMVPEFDLEVAFEWSHRVLAASVGLAFATLAALMLRSGCASGEARRWLAAAAALLATQVLLGALTVWKLLAAWTVTSHLVTGNAFALALLFVSLGLRERPRGERASSAVRGGVSLVATLLLLQLVLGGLVSSRFAGMACPEWPTCNGGDWLPSLRGSVGLHLLHRWNGTLLAAALVAVAWISRGEPRLRHLTAGAATLAALQVAVGVANVLLGLPVEITGLHSALAAGLVLAVGAATRAAWIHPRPG